MILPYLIKVLRFLLIVLNGIEILNLAYDKIKHKNF